MNLRKSTSNLRVILTDEILFIEQRAQKARVSTTRNLGYNEINMQRILILYYWVMLDKIFPMYKRKTKTATAEAITLLQKRESQTNA